MHELSIAQSILDIVTRHAEREGVERVTRVGIRIGGLSCIEPSSLTFCFDIIKKGSPASSALLDIEKESVRGFCNDCGRAFDVRDLVAGCPLCRGRDFRVTGDDDMKVMYLEVE